MPPPVCDRAAAPTPFSAESSGVKVRVRLTPKAARNGIGAVHADADGNPVLKIAVTAAPEGGKANAALIKLLAREWRLPKSAFTIAAGATERRKVLKIEGESARLMAHLANWYEEQDWTKGD